MGPSPSNNSPAAELELRIVGNNSVSEPLIRPDRPLSHNERQNRLLMLGGVMWAAAFVVNGVGKFATDNGSTHQALLGVLLLGQALLQTIGTMVVAAADADLDLFAKKHPRFVVAFSLVWIVLYNGLCMHKCIDPPDPCHQPSLLGQRPAVRLPAASL